MGTVVICTALETEYHAVRAHVSGPLDEREVRGTLYEIGTFPAPHGHWTVALTQTGAGNTPAAIELERAISVFHPRCVLFVGVAGGRKDVALGDVVIADHVYDYESGKDTAAGYLPRIKTAAPSSRLLNRARQVARDRLWQCRIPGPAVPDVPKAVVKPIAAGGKVVADQRSATARLLDQHCGDAAAVEMEGHGFLHGAYLNHQVEALVVRGISDLLSGKTEAADEYWQPIAARHAAAFAFELLARHTPAAAPMHASAASRRRRGVIAAAALAVVAAAVTGVVALSGGFDATGRTTPPKPQVADSSAVVAQGDMSAKNNDWINLAKGYAANSIPPEPADFFARNFRDPSSMELFSASETSAFAEIDGDVSKQSCSTALRSRRDQSIKATPDLIGRWVCARTWNNGIAALKIGRVDPDAASIELSYLVWQ
nr:5'-methylthioadenosine/S-adenosylhomocysteine nucleosidase [Amycolatopsis sp. SID8362]